MRVLIIEDEPFAQKELVRLLKVCDPSIEVLRCIDSVEESAQYLEENPDIELIFMDIQLSDGISFEIFNLIEIKIPVIFTTAYDEYAIRAFKVNSIDYLLKPVDEEDLKRGLEKFKLLKGDKTSEQGQLTTGQISEILGLYRPAYKSRLVTKMGDRIFYVEVSGIAYIYSEDKVTFLITREGNRHIINYTLEQVEGFLDPADFYRLNRKYLTHIDAIESISKYFNSRLKIQLKPAVEDEILISRAKVPGFMEWLEK
jgi:DNA-binding LytR/AlgR family response regulator